MLLPPPLDELGWRVSQAGRKESGCSDSKESACNAGDLDSILHWEDVLEKEMTTHSSLLAWKIPWAEEPGRLWSMRSQRVGHY